jgi:hypothetical protein
MSAAVVSVPVGVRSRNGDVQRAGSSATSAVAAAAAGTTTSLVVSRSWHSQQQQQQQNSGALILNVNHHHDEAVMRFAAPASRDHEHRLAGHMAAARAAYAKAYLLIRKTSKEDAALVADIDGPGGGEQSLVDTARDILSTTPAKDHVSDFVSGLHHYHGVFDVLCQADFSYLSVIWGGMKLILIMMKNRSDLLVSITDMLIEIGYDLSRVEVCTKMYPTNRMLELTSMLYGAVVDFLKEVIEHFQQTKMKMFWSSMTKPFEQRFGYVKARIQNLVRHIQKDFILLQAMSSAQQSLEPRMQRMQFENALSSMWSCPNYPMSP